MICGVVYQGRATVKEDLQSLQKDLGSRYQLSRELGRGGMATVYLAEDTERGERVAVKVLRRELTVILGQTRFHREIQILTRLEHPNIVRILDSRQAGARFYYVMPFVSGDSLRARLDRQGSLQIEEVISISRDIAAGLDHAHARGILHRDIKPENVLLEKHRALVCDFGISRAIEVAGDESFSSSGLVLGTPAYMSPEQATGGEIDARSDVYALGCLLFEMLTGEPPFTGASAQAVFARHLSERPRPIRTPRPDVSPEMEQAVLTALAKSPAARPATATALVRLMGAEFG
jgi:eukaryotic-like serine/threonine-protein kinase